MRLQCALFLPSDLINLKLKRSHWHAQRIITDLSLTFTSPLPLWPQAIKRRAMLAAPRLNTPSGTIQAQLPSVNGPIAGQRVASRRIKQTLFASSFLSLSSDCLRLHVFAAVHNEADCAADAMGQYPSFVGSKEGHRHGSGGEVPLIAPWPLCLAPRRLE